jgi:hypothetical protein
MKARRALAVVAILAILVAAVTSTASELLTFVLVPLGPLFGTIVVASPAPEPSEGSVRPDPVVPTLSPRPPPLG